MSHAFLNYPAKGCHDETQNSRNDPIQGSYSGLYGWCPRDNGRGGTFNMNSNNDYIRKLGGYTRRNQIGLITGKYSKSSDNFYIGCYNPDWRNRHNAHERLVNSGALKGSTAQIAGAVLDTEYLAGGSSCNWGESLNKDPMAFRVQEKDCPDGFNKVNFHHGDSMLGAEFFCRNGDTVTVGSMTSRPANTPILDGTFQCPEGQVITGLSGNWGYRDKADREGSKDSYWRQDTLRQLRVHCNYKKDCAKDNNIFDKDCHQYEKAVGTVRAAAIKNEWCDRKENVTSSQCKDWCIQSRDPNRNCAKGAEDYCKDHPNDDEFCACMHTNALRSASKDPTIDNDTLKLYSRYAPICWNAKCIVGDAYMPRNAEGANVCPKCVQNIKIGKLNSKDSQLALNQSCSIEAKGENETRGMKVEIKDDVVGKSVSMEDGTAIMDGTTKGPVYTIEEVSSGLSMPVILGIVIAVIILILIIALLI